MQVFPPAGGGVAAGMTIVHWSMRRKPCTPSGLELFPYWTCSPLPRTRSFGPCAGTSSNPSGGDDVSAASVRGPIPGRAHPPGASMLNWLSNPNLLLAGVIFAALQFLAALPWLRAIDPKGFDRGLRSPASLGTAVLAVLGIGAVIAGYIGYKGEGTNLAFDGKVYGSILHLQLLVDFFILAP